MCTYICICVHTYACTLTIFHTQVNVDNSLHEYGNYYTHVRTHKHPCKTYTHEYKNKIMHTNTH